MTPDDDRAAHLEERLDDSWDRIESFLETALGDHTPPVYLSSDVRDAGYKTASVDTNAFPAGFNNLCPGDRSTAATTMREYLDRHHPDTRRVLLLPENHTRNPHYLHNVDHLSQILEEAGIDHTIGSADPEVVYAVQGTATPEGHILRYELVVCKDGTLVAGSKEIDLVLSNNDFTTGAPTPLSTCGTATIPSPDLGWATRSKAKHFALYNHLAKNVARVAGLEPWRLTLETQSVGPLDFKKREGLEALADTVDTMIADMKSRNETHGIDEKPHVFIKDVAGTYGMGIMVASSGEDVRTMNNRARQKMDKGKYGHKVSHVIVQEAVPTQQKVDGVSAETVAYLIGTDPVGAFMRLHDKRGDMENLNQPGMRFMPICIHGDCADPTQAGCVERRLTRREQLASRLAALALVHETTGGNVKAEDAARVTLPPLEEPTG